LIGGGRGTLFAHHAQIAPLLAEHGPLRRHRSRRRVHRGDVFYDPLCDEKGKPNQQNRKHFAELPVAIRPSSRYWPVGGMLRVARLNQYADAIRTFKAYLSDVPNTDARDQVRELITQMETAMREVSLNFAR
jgi:hypothetical protein